MTKQRDVLTSRTVLDTDNIVAHNIDVSVGKTRTHFNPTIQAGVVYTVDGDMITISPEVSVGGELEINGSVTVLSETNSGGAGSVLSGSASRYSNIDATTVPASIPHFLDGVPDRVTLYSVSGGEYEVLDFSSFCKVTSTDIINVNLGALGATEILISVVRYNDATTL